MTQDILTCALDRWTAIWGDPVLSGTLFTLAYGAAAVLTMLAARRSTGDDRTLWWVCTGLLLLEAINTHLDLHAFPGSLARCMAHAQGWYAQKATVKLLVVGVTALLIALVVLWIAIRYRAALWNNLLLSVGMALSFGFTLLRGYGIPKLENAYANTLGGLPLSSIVEMSGIALVVISAVIKLKQADARPI